MTDTYNIYLINQSADTQLFWLFLAPPVEIANSPEVFANSAVAVAVIANSPDANYFNAPLQYVIGAGASNNSVGLNVEITSNISQVVSLGEAWNVSYATVPPNMGPTMLNSGGAAPSTAIAIMTNNFDKIRNEDAGWFGNQSFGIQTEAGFVGMTWSPDPGQTQTLTPLLQFYVAIGDYGENALASWGSISQNSSVINTPGDFENNNCTVTYTESGTWQVTAGLPASVALR